MAVLIFLVVLFGLYVVWKASREYIRTGTPTTWSKVALWGVYNFSPVGFGVIAVICALCKIWPLFLITVAVWVVYRMIRKDLDTAGLLDVSP